MINTGKKDLFVSYIAYFLRLSSNLLLLPVILGMLNSEEYGLWNIFISLGAIVNLVDIGFGAVLTRYSTYAYCGAESISTTGMPVIGQTEQTNHELLFRVFRVAKQIYARLFFISLGISFALSGYIWVKAAGLMPLWKLLLSWAIYALSCCFYIYYVAYNCMIKGMGKVKESNYYYIVQQIVYLAVGYTLLLMGWGLLGLALASLISTFVFRALNIRFLNKRFSQYRSVQQQVEKESPEQHQEIYDAVKKNTSGIALVTVSHYVSQYGMTLICSLFLPLSVIGSIGITNQMVGVVGTMAGTVFATYMSKMGDMLINGRKQELRKMFATVNRGFFLIYIAGSVLVVFVGPFALRFIGSDTQLLETGYVLLMLLNSLIVNNHQRCTNFIMLSNEQPHIRAYFISSAVSVMASLLCMYFVRNALGYIIPSMIVQLLYNGWKWPLMAYQKLGSD